MTAVKRTFFDRAKVMKAMDDATRRNLSRSGANIRKYAQRSLKYRKSTSLAGSPPHVHRTTVRHRKSKSTGRVRTQNVSPLREYILFGYDASGGFPNVVIGPILWKQSPRAAKATSIKAARRPTTPGALEFGGDVLFSGKTGKSRTVKIAARPYMRPALAVEKRNLPSIWSNSVRP